MKDYEHVNEDLINITKYEVLGDLPNPFVFENGKSVKTKKDWESRRKEIYKNTVELQYGVMPPDPEFLDVEILSHIYNGFHTYTYLIHTGTYKNPVRFTMTVFQPRCDRKYPAVIDGDMSFSRVFDPRFIHTFIDNEIMLVLFNRTELAPDIKDSGRNGQLYSTYSDGNFTALAAWAWGYSRCVDALEKIGYADMSCITFTGHSRGGKVAMLAGAVDERAAIVNPNATCAGGCGCNRLHIEAIDENGKKGRSETLKDITDTFPFWFTPELASYAEKENELPFDSHYMKALVAPRVLFVSEAGSDIWANPVGSWQTTKAAEEVFKFLDAKGNIFWYFRNGYHDHNVRNLNMLVNIILHFYKGEPLDDDFFHTPFKKPKLMFDWKCPEKENE